jgi:hypothetical protein
MDVEHSWETVGLCLERESVAKRVDANDTFTEHPEGVLH